LNRSENPKVEKMSNTNLSSTGVKKRELEINIFEIGTTYTLQT
jgi:hypothetical protein